MRDRSLWGRKVSVLRYLEAFHLAADLDSLIGSLRTFLEDELGAAATYFSLLDERKRHLVYYYPEALKGLPVVAGEGFSGLALAAGRTVCFRSSEAPLPYHAFPETESFPRPRKSVLATPLQRDGRVIATIELIDRTDGDEFSGADAAYLDALAPHMAVGVNHFVLLREARRREDEEDRLREVSRAISASFNLGEILESILRHLRGLIPYDAATILLFSETAKSPGDPDPEEMATYGLTEEERDHLVDQSYRIQADWLENGALARILSREDCEDLRYCMRIGESQILMPLRNPERITGLFLLVSDQRDAFAQADLELLEAFGSQASLAIERARLHRSLIEKTQLEQELKIARDIQLRFLPREMPKIRGLRVAACNVASQTVSGDYYDFIPIVEGQWGIVIGDVASKGISAGLIMSAFRASLLAEIRNNFSIATILVKVNRLLWETIDRNRFVTAFYGVFDEKERVLTYSNAGHNPPLLRRSDGSFHQLQTGGLLMGSFEKVGYVEERLHILPGDLLVLYTDGLTEAPLGPDGAELGISGLEQIVRECHALPPSEFVARLVSQVTEHSPSGVPEDDATLVVIKAE